MLVISGPSGGGKTTVANLIIEKNRKFEFVRSATTRAPRGDGNDGEYLYYSRDQFKRAIEENDFLEYTDYGKNFYGTPRSELERIFADGRIPLLVLDMNGAETIGKGEFDFCADVFYVFEDINVIESRLYKRELLHPSVEGIESFIRRKNENINDYLRLPELSSIFTGFIRNTVAETARDAILSVFFKKDNLLDQSIYIGERRKIIAEELCESARAKI